MKQIRVLDCTLRDGGRIIDCKFKDNDTMDIITRLAKAKIDVIEVGFLRDPQKVQYKGDSTFFTRISQVNKLIDKSGVDYDASYVVFIDYSMFDFSTLESYQGKGINGIRVGFTKNDYIKDSDNLIKALNLVKSLGYELYVQGVNSLAYSDKEFLNVISMVNDTHPDVFAIVDTYGAMYLDDLDHIFSLTNKNLNPEISIAFHSHNNYQLSFALAQEFIRLGKESSRNIVIDSTLDGMGKCSGNLNTELIVDFLIRKLNYKYDFEAILDIIDDYMYNIKKQYSWGYSIPSMMAAVYQAHPNNVIYLTEKYRLATKDIKRILSMIPDDIRKSYDYDLISELYVKYNHTNVDDSKVLSDLKSKFDGKRILIMVPGRSLLDYSNEIVSTANNDDVIVVPVNFVNAHLSKDKQIPFFGSEKRYQKFSEIRRELPRIVTSNIFEHDSNDFVVNYEGLVERNNEDFDTSIIMLLNLLLRLETKDIIIAGFDGFDENSVNYFDEALFEDGRFRNDYKRLTENTISMLKELSRKFSNCCSVEFLTPSKYEQIFIKQ